MSVNDKKKRLIDELNSRKDSKNSLIEKGKLFFLLPFFATIIASFSFLAFGVGMDMLKFNKTYATGYFVVGFLFALLSCFVIGMYYDEDKVKRKKLILLWFYSRIQFKEKELEALEE